MFMFQITTVLWIIFILHPGRSSILLETVTITFGGPSGGGPRTDMWGGGPRTDMWGGGLMAEKNKYPLLGSIFYDSLL